ncbi:MAG: hypothetical protein ABIS17_08820 [Casimicrobiaceae bacterium]
MTLVALMDVWTGHDVGVTGCRTGGRRATVLLQPGAPKSPAPKSPFDDDDDEDGDSWSRGGDDANEDDDEDDDAFDDEALGHVRTASLR